MYTQEILDHKTLHSLAVDLAQKHGDREAFHEEFGDRKISKSYRGFLQDIEALAAALKRRYLGGHIALLMRGSIEFYMLFFAVILSGGVAIPIDCDATDDETLREIQHSDSVAVFYSQYREKKVEGIKHAADNVEFVCAEDNIDHLIIKGSLLKCTNFADDKPDAPAAIFYTSGTTGVSKGVVLPQKALASVACSAGCHVDVYESVLSVLPAHHTYGSVCGVLSIYALAKTVFFTKNLKTFMGDLKKYEPSNLFLVPMFLQSMYKMIWAQAEKQNKDILLKQLIRVSNGLAVASNVFVVPIFINTIVHMVGKITSEQRAEREANGREPSSLANMMLLMTNIFVIPTYIFSMFRTLWSQAKNEKNSNMMEQITTVQNSLLSVKADVRRAIFKSVLAEFGGNLKTITSGGAPLDVKLQRSFEELGIQVLNGYGITECAPLVAVNISRQNRFGTVGRALPYCDIMIEDAGLSGVGEVCVRGDNVMLGYYKDDEATREVLVDGWYHTGDVGYVDDDGYLFITGRKKDMIVIPSGENIFPETIEKEFYRLRYIGDAVVMWDDRAQTLCAHVYFEEGQDSSSFEKDLQKINAGFPPYMKMKKFVVHDKPFEKTTTKKIKRFAVK